MTQAHVRCTPHPYTTRRFACRLWRISILTQSSPVRRRCRQTRFRNTPGRLPKWVVKDGAISKTFDFKNYLRDHRVRERDRLGQPSRGPSPDLDVGYNRCKVTYSTHSVGGLSENDFILRCEGGEAVQVSVDEAAAPAAVFLDTFFRRPYNESLAERAKSFMHLAMPPILAATSPPPLAPLVQSLIFDELGFEYTTLNTAIYSAILVAGPFLILISLVAMFCIWWERKVAGHMQSRLGPNRVGPIGLLQSLADGVKLLTKEDLVPPAGDTILFRLAPYLAFAPAFAAFLALPYAPDMIFAPTLNVGLFWILAILSVEVMGVILAGWASNNKWSVYGAMREACQMVSYEIPLGISIIVGVVAARHAQHGRARPHAGRRHSHLADLPRSVRLRGVLRLLHRQPRLEQARPV
jgi:pterin-4a-carbinolamine dehydratase